MLEQNKDDNLCQFEIVNKITKTDKQLSIPVCYQC